MKTFHSLEIKVRTWVSVENCLSQPEGLIRVKIKISQCCLASLIWAVSTSPGNSFDGKFNFTFHPRKEIGISIFMSPIILLKTSVIPALRKTWIFFSNLQEVISSSPHDDAIAVCSQVQRRKRKLKLIADLESRVGSEPVPLPSE